MPKTWLREIESMKLVGKQFQLMFALKQVAERRLAIDIMP
jgi:hypothetical protein